MNVLSYLMQTFSIHQDNLYSPFQAWKRFSEPIHNIRDFYLQYTEEGLRVGELNDELSKKLIRIKPKTKEHAKAIVQIYNEIYQNSYPFKEMVDHNFIYSHFNDPSYFWRLVLNKENNDPVGIFTIVIDDKTGTGYLRGLNIRPKYQGKAGVKRLAYGLIWDFVHSTKGKIFRWYNESRTAHNKTQYLSYKIGAHTCAILLNKDYFFGKKETDVMMITYWPDALYYFREIPNSLPEQIEPFYNYITEQFNLDNRITPNFYRIRKIDWERKYTSEILQLYKEIQMIKNVDSFGYQHVKWIIPSTAERVEILYTPTVKNIEKIKGNIESFPSMAAIYIKMLEFIKENNIEYWEWRVPVNQNIIIDFLIQEGAEIFGYLPAWNFGRDESKIKLIDYVVLGWTRIMPDFEKIKLLEDGLQLLALVEKYNVNYDISKIDNITEWIPAILNSEIIT